MADNPITLTQGTTANATDVESKVNPLYTDITNSNISASAAIVFSKLDSTTVCGVSATQTLTNKTLTSPTINTPTINNATINSFGTFTPGWISNLGISLSAGVFTIAGADATALSSTNIGYVTVPSTTAGRLVQLNVQANATFGDAAGTSDLTNLGFGITEAQSWAQDMPFFVYVVNRGNSNIDATDGNSKFFIARSPTLQVTPSTAGNIGDTGTIPTSDNQNCILILGTITEANYTSLPCQLIGTFRMRWASTDWTVQTLGQSDGLGTDKIDNQLSSIWTFPQQQNGASASTYLLANGGTAPTFGTTNEYFYMIRRDGTIKVFVNLVGNSGTDGAGAVTTQVALPATESSGGLTDGAFGIVDLTDVANVRQATAAINAADVFFTIKYPASATAMTTLQHGAFTDGDRVISTSFEYKAFITAG